MNINLILIELNFILLNSGCFVFTFVFLLFFLGLLNYFFHLVISFISSSRLVLLIFLHSVFVNFFISSFVIIYEESWIEFEQSSSCESVVSSFSSLFFSFLLFFFFDFPFLFFLSFFLPLEE